MSINWLNRLLDGAAKQLIAVHNRFNKYNK